MNFDQAIKYRDKNFACCPYCESTEIEAGSFSFEIMGTGVMCHDCGKEWQDNYSIVSVGFRDKNDEYQEHGIDLESRLRA